VVANTHADIFAMNSTFGKRKILPEYDIDRKLFLQDLKAEFSKQ